MYLVSFVYSPSGADINGISLGHWSGARQVFCPGQSPRGCDMLPFTSLCLCIKKPCCQLYYQTSGNATINTLCIHPVHIYVVLMISLGQHSKTKIKVLVKEGIIHTLAIYIFPKKWHWFRQPAMFLPVLQKVGSNPTQAHNCSSLETSNRGIMPLGSVANKLLKLCQTFLVKEHL